MKASGAQTAPSMSFDLIVTVFSSRPVMQAMSLAVVTAVRRAFPALVLSGR